MPHMSAARPQNSIGGIRKGNREWKAKAKELS